MSKRGKIVVLPWEVSRTAEESPIKKAGRKKVYREKSAEAHRGILEKFQSLKGKLLIGRDEISQFNAEKLGFLRLEFP